VLEAVERLLQASSRIVVATGILNVWMHDAAEVAAGHARLQAEYGDRFLLGLGISHAHFVDAEEPGRYRRPLATMRAYLDAIDAAGGGDQPRILAALGPRMLELARERSLGAHPYLSPVEHTRFAREALGGDPILAPTLAVVLETDPAVAREVARADLELYLKLPNYTNMWRRLGYEVDGAGDALVDELYAWGSLEQIGRRLRAHQEAGADHVCFRAVRGDQDGFPRRQWRTLAEAFL
jgi:probable F420-dependent oxidoreductase